jgi:hypothetical protein
MPLTGSKPCSSRRPLSSRTRPVRRPFLPGSKKLMFSLKLLCRRDCRCGVCDVVGCVDMSSRMVVGECDKCAGQKDFVDRWSLGGLSLCFGASKLATLVNKTPTHDFRFGLVHFLRISRRRVSSRLLGQCLFSGQHPLLQYHTYLIRSIRYHG